MGITAAIAVSSVQLFKLRLLGRMQSLARQTGDNRFVVPVALFLLHDADDGGAIGGEELGRRFGLKDFELPNLIDSYFLGWSYSRLSSSAGHLHFDPASCNGFRRTLGAAGVQGLGGRAELLMVDAAYGEGNVRLQFHQAVRIDLAAAAATRRLPSAGALLQTFVDFVAAQKARPAADGLQLKIGSPLGIAVGDGPLAAWMVARWARHLGAAGFGDAESHDLGAELKLIDL